MAQDSAAPPPEARARFASQLRRLRVQKGFATARQFALAIGIEENRYTRYERAEVEPSLTVLLEMLAETWGVSPMSFLGFRERP